MNTLSPSSPSATSRHATDPLHLVEEVSALLGAIDERELDVVFHAGTTLAERGDLERAADAFRFVTLADPLRTDAWRGLAQTHEARGDHETAACLYELGYLMGDHDATLGLLGVRALGRAGELEAALELLDDVAPHATDEVEQGAATALRRWLERAS